MDRAYSSVVEHCVDIAGVGSSILPTPTIRKARQAKRLSGLFRGLALAASLLLAPDVARAGPPFLTDDPAPTELHRWEIYDFVAGAHEAGETAWAGGLDLNYGAVKGVQLTAVLPLEKDPGEALHAGDVELAAKLRLIRQQEGGFPLDVTVFPRVFLPTGRGSHRARLLLPVWVGHEAGPWQVFGGGGYTIDAEAGHRNFWQQGIAVNRAIGDRVQLGIEYFGQQADVAGEPATHLINVGTTIRLGGPFSLLGSFGQGLTRRQTVFYTALKLDM